MEDWNCSEKFSFVLDDLALRESPFFWRCHRLFPLSAKVFSVTALTISGVSLIPIASNFLTSVIHRGLHNASEGQTHEAQAEFCAGRGCVD